MSLFQWSTPARQNAKGRDLPIIPNEIYFYLFEHIAPPPQRLTPEEVRIFTNLSRVCRFFANVCLPRLFEVLEFSGNIFHDDTPSWLRNPSSKYKTSRESALCMQLSEKQPLALALAKQVKVCHFRDWKQLDDGTGAWAVRMFANIYLSSMTNMTNIRELKFLNSFVDVEHWTRIAGLTSLEELSFEWCQFLHGPADFEPAKFKTKVPRVRVVNCSGVRHVIAAIDVQHVRSLSMDFLLFDQLYWLSESALTEISLSRPASWLPAPVPFLDRLHTILVRAPRSLETLGFFLDVSFAVDRDFVQSVFGNPAWENFPLLCSLTLKVRSRDFTKPTEIVAVILEGIGLLTKLQSFTLKDSFTPEISGTEIQHILEDKLGPTSNLKHVEIYSHVLRSVNGRWLEVLSRT